MGVFRVQVSGAVICANNQLEGDASSNRLRFSRNTPAPDPSPAAGRDSKSDHKRLFVSGGVQCQAVWRYLDQTKSIAPLGFWIGFEIPWIDGFSQPINRGWPSKDRQETDFLRAVWHSACSPSAVGAENGEFS
jgi:hypothetical protein